MHQILEVTDHFKNLQYEEEENTEDEDMENENNNVFYYADVHDFKEILEKYMDTFKFARKVSDMHNFDVSNVFEWYQRVLNNHSWKHQ